MVPISFLPDPCLQRQNPRVCCFFFTKKNPRVIQLHTYKEKKTLERKVVGDFEMGERDYWISFPVIIRFHKRVQGSSDSLSHRHLCSSFTEIFTTLQDRSTLVEN